jgi:hypothetical protein
MNIVEAIELLEHKLFDQGRSEQYTAYDKLIDDAWDLLKSKLDLRKRRKSNLCSKQLLST